MKTRDQLSHSGFFARCFSLFALALLLLASLPVIAAPDEPENLDLISLHWTTQTVDSSEKYEHMSNRSLRIAGSGRVGVAFGGRKLYYAQRDGSSYAVTTVDSSYNVGSHASLAFDSGNNPHISYFDATNGKLKYAARNGSSWSVETVHAAGSGIVGLYSSIDLDGYTPYIVFYDATNQELGIVYKLSGGWIKEVINTVGDAGKYASLDMVGNTPHVSYYNATDDALMYATKVSGVWQNVMVDRRLPTDPAEWRGVGQFTSLIVNNSQAHISYYDAIRGDLKYARVRQDGSNFVIDTELVLSITGQKVGLFTSIALSSSDPFISFFNETTDDLIYAYTTDDGWRFSTVASDGQTGLYTSLAIDGTTPYISFYDLERRRMRVARLSGSTWDLTTLQTAGYNGQYASMQLDSDDRPHIAYYDDGAPGLRYARWDGSQWIYWILELGQSNGLHASLALDSNNHPHIAYYNGATNDLRYIRWTGSAWTQVVVIDEDGDVGKWASLAIDSNNYPHISYYDAGRRNLKYARYTGSAWETQTVDNTFDRGAHTSLALDTSNQPHITYFDEANDALRYAYLSGGAWQYEVIDEQFSTGLYSSLEMDAGNRPHVSYYDFTAYAGLTPNLKYAYRTGPGQWTVETVDTSQSANLVVEGTDTQSPETVDVVDAAETVLPFGVGAYSSLALDVDGRPHISYYDADNQDLRYAVRLEAGWSTRPVFTPNEVGLHTSLDLTSSGLPKIAFHDATLRELKLATSAIYDYALFLPNGYR